MPTFSMTASFAAPILCSTLLIFACLSALGSEGFEVACVCASVVTGNDQRTRAKKLGVRAYPKTDNCRAASCYTTPQGDGSLIAHPLSQGLYSEAQTRFGVHQDAFCSELQKGFHQSDTDVIA